ncbi:MAG: peptidase C39 bacteriocin processing [Thiothrix lacustris]|uniref:Peptidase C39 bacteriocin processing n=1 Tax=Thiothrix lacustris TaxID=525917 RepID=A0A1Y1QHZ1_9GAMM|nr:MAG: peptidase C39 bacteriocin processing [Thiothrix lacustris]
MRNTLIKGLLPFLISCLVILPLTGWAEEVRLTTRSVSGELPVQSWKALRDKRVVKQDLDYSCGAASIATLLSEYYRRPTTELEVLKLLAKGGNRASFADMQRILPELGFKGIGLATSWEQLVSLKLPVIVYVRQRKEDHFTVLRGISDTHVSLADPSLGNRILTRQQFKEIWETRDQPGLEGKMLAILPNNADTQVTDKQFFAIPQFPNLPLELLVLRKLP